jgi:hypothetical protein
MIFAKFFFVFPLEFEIFDNGFFLFQLIESNALFILSSLVHFFVPVDGLSLGFEFFVEEGDELVRVDGLLGEGAELGGLFVHFEAE